MGKFSLSLFFFSLSLAIPQFELISHIKSLRLPSGHSGLVFTVSNAARASLFSPHLLVVDVSIWATFPLGGAVRCVNCGFYLFIFPPGYVVLWDCKTPHRPAGERVSWCLELLLFYNSLPGLVSIPNSFVSLFIFYILSYLLLKTMGCLSGCLVSFASVHELFRGIFSVFKCSFDEFVGEKVVSLSYLSFFYNLLYVKGMLVSDFCLQYE